MRKIFPIILSLSLVCAPAWGGVDFNGDADSIKVSSNIGITSYPISTYSLVEASDLDTWAWGFGVSGEGNRYLALVVLENTNAIRYYVRDNSDSLDINGFCSAQYSASIVPGDKFKVVTISTDSTHHSLYVNGSLAETDGHTCSIPVFDSVSVGGVFDSSPSYGDLTIHEFAVWDSELSANDITNLSNSNVRLANQIAPSNLMLYFRLDDYTEGHGTLASTTWKDYSGNGNDGSGTDADNDSDVIAEQVLSYP